MASAPVFMLFPAEKFEAFKATIHSAPRIDKRRILGIFPIVTEVNRLSEFINTQTTNITDELETGTCNSIGYCWFNEYLTHEKEINLFSETSCALSHSTEGRGGKTRYAVYDRQHSADLLGLLNQLNITEKSFDEFAEKVARKTETAEKSHCPEADQRILLGCIKRVDDHEQVLGQDRREVDGIVGIAAGVLIASI